MKKFARIICLLIAVSLTVAMFGGCGGDSGNDSGSKPMVNVDEVISKADISFIDADGDSTYRVVRPDAGGELYGESAKTIFQAIKNVCGVTARNVSDTEDPEGYAEILIGNTNREASQKAYQVLEAKGSGRVSDYVICSIGDDIAIVANSDDALKKAISHFCNTYIKTEVITGGINDVYALKDSYSDIKIFGMTTLSKIDIVRPIYNVSWITQSETDKIIEFLTEKTGYKLDLVNDQIASKNYINNPNAQSDGSGTLTPSTPGEYEIIIGNCVRDGVKVLSNLDEYEIRIEDKKIFLNGGSPYATAMAVSEFLKLLQNNTEITASASVTSGNYQEAIKSYDNATYYKPTWFDEFSGTQIDETKWNIHWGEACYTKNELTNKQGYRGNKELKNNFVKDGKLYYVGIETEDSYYGGLLTTRDTMDYKYGYIELSNIHPNGVGFWVALYPISGGVHLPEGTLYTQETDVDECYGNGGNWCYQNTFAWPTNECKNLLGDEAKTVHVRNDFYCKDDRGLWMDFHTFGYNWISNKHVQFTVDGYITFDQKLEDPAEQIAYSVPANLRLANSVGSQQHGAEPSGSKAWEESSSYINDYVYIYQLKGHELWVNDGEGSWNNRNQNWQHFVW